MKHGPLSASLILILVCGCGYPTRPQGYYHKADGRAVPTEWSGAVQPLAQRQATRPLQYDSLYVSEVPNFGRYYFRFWPGGEVMWWLQVTGDIKGPLTAADGDSFVYSCVGRYAVVGDVITTEFTGVDETGDHYILYRGVVNEDGSFTISRRFDGVFHPEGKPLTCRRVIVGEMKRFPDW